MLRQQCVYFPFSKDCITEKHSSRQLWCNVSSFGNASINQEANYGPASCNDNLEIHVLGIHVGSFSQRPKDSLQTLLLVFLIFSKEIRAASTLCSLLLLLPCEVASTCLSCSAGKLVQSQHCLSFPRGCQENDDLISRLFSSTSSQVNIPISEGHGLPCCVPLTLCCMLEAWR